MIEIYCTSYIVLSKKCLSPVINDPTTVKNSASAMNAAITDLLFLLYYTVFVQAPELS